MAAPLYRTTYMIATLVALCALFASIYHVHGLNDIYSNSHISPNSEHHIFDDPKEKLRSSDLSSNPSNIIFASQPIYAGADSFPPQQTIRQTRSYSSEIDNDDIKTVPEPHVIVLRSASPILGGRKQQSPYDVLHLVASKDATDNVESNDVDLRLGKYQHLSPTRTLLSDSGRGGQMQMSSISGEAWRAPRGKVLPLQEPTTSIVAGEIGTTTSRNFAHETPRGRQANPDIQDIITGIVKLLNGNVNVQANTAPPIGRPHRPVNTRINNRGPPRISDVPPLPPDFDSPNQVNHSPPSGSVLPPPPVGQMTPPPPAANTPMPTKIPPPYPFDLPHPHPNNPPVRPFLNGIPIPEQLVPLAGHRPQGGGNMHGGGRPLSLLPWRRRPRPPQRHPPTIGIPPYKPLPPMEMDMDNRDEISLTSEDPANHMTPEVTLTGDPHNPSIPITEIQEVINSNVGQTEATFHDLGDQINKHHQQNNMHDNLENIAVTEIIPETTPNPVEFIHKDEYINKEEFISKEEFMKDEKKPINKEKDKPFNIKSDKPNQTSDFETEPSPIITDVLETESFDYSSENSVINSSPVITEINISTMDITTSEPVSTNNYEIKEELPVLTEVEGIGEAIPVLETSIKDMETIMSSIDADASISSSSQSTPTEGLPSHTSDSSTIDSQKTEVTSTATEVNIINSQPTESQTPTLGGFPYYPYRPRPGIVLDDTEYKPGGQNRRPTIITARPPLGGPGELGEIFDVTVSAIQGPGGNGQHSGHGKPFVIPVEIEGVHLSPTNADVITSPSGSEGFVSIDGKRTYLNLFGDATDQPSSSTRVTSVIKPTKTSDNTVQVTGTGYAVPQTEISGLPSARPGSVGAVKPTPRRPVFGKRPQPPVRIDTCIVGDDSTCDASQHEICRTDMGVSSCHCRPGHSRRKHREPCRRVVAILMSLRVDKMYERRIVWNAKLANKESDEFRQLSFEASRAMDSAMSMTPFSDDFIEAKVNNIYKGDPAAGTAGVFVNLTVHLDEVGDTVRPQVKADIQRHLLGAIQRRSNNIGNSALWVDSPAGAVSGLHDLDECSSSELNDCHQDAICFNIFGGFNCQCEKGLRDPWPDNRARAGRKCESCPSSYCNNRGQCKYEKGQQVCVCQGNYYGSQCEVDGEVVGVAVGASVAAIIIIVLTLVCLVMWSRKWNREQKAAAAAAGGLGGLGSPVFGYMATGAGGTVKTPAVGPPPYQLTLEDRMRWAHLADVMAQANHYAPEPGGGITRPSSAVFGGYPTLSMHGTLGPPVPLPRLGLHMASTAQARAASVHNMNLRPGAALAAANDNTSSSEEEDRADLLGRNFQVPRPKSRSSVANQSGIYYDVDYDQGELYKHPAAGGIPMSTYTPGRPPYFRN